MHCVKINQNPEITIGGYFIIAQMVCYSKYLVSLDLSGNDLTAAAARVLSIGYAPDLLLFSSLLLSSLELSGTQSL